MVVEIDPDIGRLAYALTPKYFRIQSPMFPPHLSIVRKEICISPEWGKREGDEVTFFYDSETRNDETYHWLRAWGDDLDGLRADLGLPHRAEITASPDLKDRYHITIGNTKHLQSVSREVRSVKLGEERE